MFFCIAETKRLAFIEKIVTGQKEKPKLAFFVFKATH